MAESSSSEPPGMSEPFERPHVDAAPGWDDVVRDLRRSRSIAPENPARGRHAATPRSGFPRGRRLLAVGALLVVVCGLVLVGMRWHPGETTGLRSVVVDETWTDIVRRLDATRVDAWTRHDDRALLAADVLGSAAARTDLRASAALRANGLRPRGLRFDVRIVGVVTSRSDRVLLRVVDRRPAYALVDAGGSVARQIEARSERAWQVELRRGSGGWQVAAVSALVA